MYTCNKFFLSSRISFESFAYGMRISLLETFNDKFNVRTPFNHESHQPFLRPLQRRPTWSARPSSSHTRLLRKTSRVHRITLRFGRIIPRSLVGRLSTRSLHDFLNLLISVGVAFPSFSFFYKE